MQVDAAAKIKDALGRSRDGCSKLDDRHRGAKPLLSGSRCLRRNRSAGSHTFRRTGTLSSCPALPELAPAENCDAPPTQKCDPAIRRQRYFLDDRLTPIPGSTLHEMDDKDRDKGPPGRSVC